MKLQAKDAYRYVDLLLFKFQNKVEVQVMSESEHIDALKVESRIYRQCKLRNPSLKTLKIIVLIFMFFRRFSNLTKKKEINFQILEIYPN